MKKLVSVLLALTTVFALPVQAQAAVGANEITARTAVLMDAETGQVLFNKDMYARAYPASVTKLMTGLLAVERLELDDTLTVSPTAVYIPVSNHSHIGLAPGEVVPVRDVLYALMLPSANDAANVLAEGVAGSLEDFSELMNQRAWEIGARSTRFSNAHGLHESAHYTTAYDMALITRHAAQNPRLMEFIGTSEAVMSSTNLQPMSRQFKNQQSMLSPGDYYYDSRVLGGKTGYTHEAQNTMSTIATQDGRTLICVVMGVPGRGDKFNDTKKLLDYGFSQFTKTTLPQSLQIHKTVPLGEDGEVTFSGDSSFSFLLRNDLDPSEIQVNYNIPDFLEKDASLPTYADVYIQNGDETLPPILGQQPLLAEIELLNLVLPEPAPTVQQPQTLDLRLRSLPILKFEPTPLSIFQLVTVCLLLFGLMWLVGRYMTLVRRRRRRMERFARRARIQREQEEIAANMPPSPQPTASPSAEWLREISQIAI